MKNRETARKAIATASLLVLSAAPALAKKKSSPLSDEEPAGITARGRMLAEYETAANHALEALMALHPGQNTIDHYVGRKNAGGWVVAFGRFNDQYDKFLVVYEATQGASPEAFTVKRDDPPLADAGFYYFAAKAIDTARGEFRGANRPYHAAVIPAESNQMYVYFFPAPSSRGVYPLGGDSRYLVSSDGVTIIERRQLHKTIMDPRPPGPQGTKIVSGFHSHVFSDVPEDTDVFCVLMRKPPMPEFVGAGGHAYEIQADGTIKVLK